MNPLAVERLHQIGEDMDHGQFPLVYDGGIVWPARADVIFHPAGLEAQDGKQSTTQSGKTGTLAAPGTPAAPAAPGTSPDAGGTAVSTASVPRAGDVGAGRLQELAAAYPGTEAVQAEEALWIRLPASILPDLGYRAIFVVMLMPERAIARGWAFWDGGILGLQDFGQRHRNYGDGSICAFDPLDGVWQFGDSLVTLLDLFAVWATRHLYLSQFGRWPGPQASFSPYERLREFRDDELCGCSNPRGRYAECCKQNDLQIVSRSTAAMIGHALQPRVTPAAVWEFARTGNAPTIATNGAEIYPIEAPPGSYDHEFHCPR